MVQGQGPAPLADYVCWDSGSGADSCLGDVPVGVAVSIDATGKQTFSVSAIDNTGLTSGKTNSYYVVQPLSVEAPAGPVPLGTAVGITATATDIADIDESVSVDWGDGTSSASITQNGSLFTAEHV